MKYKSLNYTADAIFYSITITVALYIATISAPGVYYDYQLILNYPVIKELYFGHISVEEYLELSRGYKREIIFFDWGGGRFHPFYLVDLVFIVKHLGSIKWAWVYEGILFLGFMMALYRTTERLAQNKYLAGFAVLLLFLHPGFWYVWTTLASTTEAQAIAFIAFSFIYYMRFIDEASFVNAVLCVFFAVLSFGFKEPMFIAVGAFAATHALLSFRSDDYRLKRLDGLLLGAVSLFLLLYFVDSIWPLLKNGLDEKGLYFQLKSRGEGSVYGLQVILGHIKTYARTDPFLVYLMMPLAVLHFVQMAIGPCNAKDKLVAAYFAGGVIWLLQYFAIGVSDAHFQYYAIPAYCFAVPALTAKLAEIFSLQRDIQSRSSRPYLKVAAAVLVILTVWPDKQYKPGAIDWFVNNRYDNKHWAETIDKAAMLVRRNQPHKTYFYFYESPRTSTIEAYKMFTIFMVDKGFLPKDFDLTYQRSNDIAWATHKVGAEYGTPKSPWSWARNFRNRSIQSGDYMIVNSLWPFLSKVDIDKVMEDFELVFGTDALYGCEAFSLTNLWRYFNRSASVLFTDLSPSAADVLFSEANLRNIKFNKEHGICSPFSNKRNFYIFRKKQ